MQKLFNKILVPVDFSGKTKIAVEKAITIAKQFNCSIHLLHVVTLEPFAAAAMAEGHTMVPYNLPVNKKELDFQLDKICKHINLLSANTIEVNYSIVAGTWNQAIIDFSNEHQIDVILIGQKGQAFRKRKMVLNPDIIASKANIPVITIPSNKRLSQLFCIVIPITDFLPIRKLLYGIYLAGENNTTLKLLGIENEKTSELVQYYLAKSYRLIKDNCTVKVEMETTYNHNVAAAVNEFAKLQSADLIIVNPGAQTKMPGFFSSLLGNIIQKFSIPPVLTVNPI